MDGSFFDVRRVRGVIEHGAIVKNVVFALERMRISFEL